PEQVRAIVGDGSRWGINISVMPEARELTCDEARKKYHTARTELWLREPYNVIVADFLPGCPHHRPFRNYFSFFSILKSSMPHTTTPDRIGLKETAPGIWVGLNSRIHPAATLTAPCWIGDEVYVCAHAHIGPATILENKVIVAPHASIVRSL